MNRFLVRVILFLFVLPACDQIPNPPVSPTLTVSPTAKPTDTPVPPTPTSAPTETPMSLVRLARGVNMGNMLEAPNEGDWDSYVQQEYFDLIKQAGFDFVRLPVNWKAHTTRTGYDDGDTGYTIEPSFFARVDEVIHWALKQDLA